MLNLTTPRARRFRLRSVPVAVRLRGSLLLVDASQVEAQTLANVYLALENDHEIIPVLNKVDLPAAEPERVKQQIEDVGLDASEIHVSGKTGEGAPTYSKRWWRRSRPRSPTPTAR